MKIDKIKKEDKIDKISNQYVLIIDKDINNKEHYYICEDMELAKGLFESNKKQLITFIKRKQRK